MNLRSALVVSLFAASQAFSTSSTTTSSSTTALCAQAPQQTRANFLAQAGMMVASASLVPTPAWAASIDPAIKGTKKDPAYEACVSKCMYDCTKPKVEGQKSRQECLPDCKKQCATTKEQLLRGTPKADAST